MVHHQARLHSMAKFYSCSYSAQYSIVLGQSKNRCEPSSRLARHWSWRALIGPTSTVSGGPARNRKAFGLLPRQRPFVTEAAEEREARLGLRHQGQGDPARTAGTYCTVYRCRVLPSTRIGFYKVCPLRRDLLSHDSSRWPGWTSLHSFIPWDGRPLTA